MNFWSAIFIRLMVLAALPFGAQPLANAQSSEESPPDPGGLLRLQVGYEKRQTAILKAHDENIEKLGAKYLEGLESLLANVKEAGDLDKTLAVSSEVERFGDEGNMPTGTILAEMVELVAAYQEQESDYGFERESQEFALDLQYEKALAPLQKTLVREGRIEEAKAVQLERTRIEDSVTKAKLRTALESLTNQDTRWKWGSGGELMLWKNGRARHSGWKREGSWKWERDGTMTISGPRNLRFVVEFSSHKTATVTAKSRRTTLTLKQ